MVEKLPFLSDEHHYAIAAVAVRAAQLDTHIEMAIANVLEFAGLRRTAENILKNMNGDRYVNLLREMFLDRLPDRKEEIETTFSEIGRLRAERNEILHWLYGKTDDADIAATALMRPFRDRQERRRTATQIHAVANGFLHKTMLVSEWGYRAIGLPWPPTLDKS